MSCIGNTKYLKFQFSGYLILSDIFKVIKIGTCGLSLCFCLLGRLEQLFASFPYWEIYLMFTRKAFIYCAEWKGHSLAS